MAPNAISETTQPDPEPLSWRPVRIREQTPHNAEPPTKPTASSSTDGFFQPTPRIRNQLEDDIALQRSLSLFLPRHVQEEVTPELAAFGDKVLSKHILDLVANAEKDLPYLKTWDSWGKRRDELVTSEGWRRLSQIGVQEGMVSIGYENRFKQHSRPYQFAKYLIWTGSSVWTTCPNLMTDGVAAMFRAQLADPNLHKATRTALQSAYSRLTSRDPKSFWCTGQWMTERQGGSDVSQTETVAEYAPELSEEESRSTGSDGTPLGPYKVSGFKWFSSATDCQMMVFLARTPNGISTFMAPMRRTLVTPDDRGPPEQGYETELNGVTIQRLKNKLGTKALPTAELVLKDVRAYLVGEEGRGTKEIAAVLNVARVHNAVTAIGFWGRGLSIVRAFARVRQVGLKPLWSKPAYVKTLARMHAEYKANVLFCMFVAALLGAVEQPAIKKYEETTRGQSKTQNAEPSAVIPDPQAAEHLLRLTTPALKGLTAKAAIAGLAECMECLGGVGYLENDDMQFNIARLFRDANVCSIWEGTTDMMAHDVLRVVYGKTSTQVMAAMDSWVSTVLAPVIDTLKNEANAVKDRWEQWKLLLRSREKDEVEMRAREVMEKLGDVVVGVLLVLDAGRDSDQVAVDTVQAWLAEKKSGFSAASEASWHEVALRDKRIVFGTENLEQPKASL